MLTRILAPSSRFSGTVGDDQTSVTAPLSVLIICSLLVLMQLYVAIPLSPVAGKDLDGSATAALGTAFSLAFAVGSVVWGPISDRYGRKAILVLGMIAITVVTAGLAAAPTLGFIAILRAAQGFLAASFAVVVMAYVSEAMPVRWRPTAIGAVTTAFLVAGIAGQVYGQAVSLAMGWRAAFILASVAFALAVPALAMVLAEPERLATADSLKWRFRQLLGLLGRPDMVLLYVATFTVLWAFVTMYTVLGPLLRNSFGLDETGVLLVRLAGLPGMALALIVGTLAGRLGAVRVAIGGLSLAATGLIVQGLSDDTLFILVLASVVFVAGIATTAPAVINLVTTRAGHARASGIGMYALALFAGASVGPLMAEFPFGFSTLVFVLAMGLILGAALIAVSTRTPINRTSAVDANYRSHR